MKRLSHPATCLVVLTSLAACDPGATTSPDDASLRNRAARTQIARTEPSLLLEIEASIREHASELMSRYADRMDGIQLLGTHWLGDPEQSAMGGFVFFNDRGNKRIGVEWVAGDPRRGGRDNVKYVIVPSAPAGLTQNEVDGAIDRAMETWDGGTQCSALSIDRADLSDPDVDVAHVGFGPLASGAIASTSIFIFVDPATGVPTDIDADGFFDYAFALIAYNSNFPWAIDGNIDVETVALHEAGHGLGQAHFGKAFATLANGFLHFSPLAVLNAGYSGIQQNLTGTDLAGHCSMYGSYPN